MRLLHGYVYRVAIDFKYADDLNVDICMIHPKEVARQYLDIRISS
jgi:hypothetical protein